LQARRVQIINDAEKEKKSWWGTQKCTKNSSQT
jgi:hypothetical protein